MTLASQPDLKSRELHFKFGQNWADYARRVSHVEIDEATRNLVRLLGGNHLTGKRVLDIGCGSGIHCLAALNLGAREIVAVDLDPESVLTSQALLQSYAAGSNFRIFETSVFDLSPDELGFFLTSSIHGACFTTRGICILVFVGRPEWFPGTAKLRSPYIIVP